MKRFLIALTAAFCLSLPLVGCGDASENEITAPSSASSEQEAVLAVEARWLTAITAGDRDTVEDILARDFKHISADGKFYDRAAEVAAMEPLPFTMNPTEQIVDIIGDTAVIHGVNTLIQDGLSIARERFTDVFVKVDGEWKALSAQETTY